jgi:hypothetical protein
MHDNVRTSLLTYIKHKKAFCAATGMPSEVFDATVVSNVEQALGEYTSETMFGWIKEAAWQSLGTRPGDPDIPEDILSDCAWETINLCNSLNATQTHEEA